LSPRAIALAGFAIGMGCALAAAPPAAAYIRVDDFRNPQDLVLEEGAEVASDARLGAKVLGGERDAELRRTDGPAGAAALEVVSNRLEVFADGAPFALTLDYDGADQDPDVLDPRGLGDVNLTEPGTGDGFAVRMRADADTLLWIQVFDTTDASGQTWSAGALEVPASQGFGWHDLPFVALVEQGPGGPADLRDVGAIRVRVSGAPTHVALDEIRVPEPAAGPAVAVLCLAAHALRRRR